MAADSAPAVAVAAGEAAEDSADTRVPVRATETASLITHPAAFPHGSMASAEDEIAAGEAAIGKLDYEAAFKHFDKATKLDSKNPIAFFGKAEAALGLPTEEADNILGWYRRAIELEPENPQFHEAIASLCMDLGRFNEAEQAYTKAAELDQENGSFYYSEFAIHYRNKAPIVMEQFMDDKTRDMIAQKSLTYALKALNLSREEAKRLLQ